MQYLKVFNVILCKCDLMHLFLVFNPLCRAGFFSSHLAVKKILKNLHFVISPNIFWCNIFLLLAFSHSICQIEQKLQLRKKPNQISRRMKQLKSVTFAVCKKSLQNLQLKMPTSLMIILLRNALEQNLASEILKVIKILNVYFVT